MPTKVVDASAVAAVIFVEPDGREVLERVQDSELASPGLLPYELANVCWKKIRRHPEFRADLIESLRDYSRLGIAEYSAPADAVLDLADRLGVSAYDAAYVWVARSLDAELVTLDRKLDRAFRDSAR